MVAFNTIEYVNLTCSFKVEINAYSVEETRPRRYSTVADALSILKNEDCIIEV